MGSSEFGSIHRRTGHPSSWRPRHTDRVVGRGQQARALHRVRLRVPQGIGRMNLLHLNVAPDGALEMTEEEAESFLRAGWEKVDAGGA